MRGVLPGGVGSGAPRLGPARSARANPRTRPADPRPGPGPRLAAGGQGRLVQAAARQGNVSARGKSRAHRLVHQNVTFKSPRRLIEWSEGELGIRTHNFSGQPEPGT